MASRDRPRSAPKVVCPDHLAAAGIAAVITYWTAAGQLLFANWIAEAIWNDGCRHPLVATRWAEIISGPGQPMALRKARAICDQVVKTKTNATSPAWLQLERTQHRIDAWLRRQARPAATRQRRPWQPRRYHPCRFSRPPSDPRYRLALGWNQLKGNPVDFPIVPPDVVSVTCKPEGTRTPSAV